jgi:ComF family protein
MPAILDLLLPPACAGCGAAGTLLCARCVAQWQPASDPADRFVAADSAVVIGQELILALAAHQHTGPMRKALARLKYEGATRLAQPLAAAALPMLVTLRAISGPAALVPIPVHRERRRERGYNQAELLARALGSALGLPCADLLERVRPTTKQHRLDRAARLANLRDAFALRHGLPAVPSVVIVVDDIVTTSATLEACAGVLSAAGVGEVYGFAIAREV